jgi:hypothetical protein
MVVVAEDTAAEVELRIAVDAAYSHPAVLPDNNHPPHLHAGVDCTTFSNNA